MISPISPSLFKGSDTNNPFDLNNTAAYQAWRDQKLKDYPTSIEELLIEIKDPRSLSATEYQAIIRSCGKTNMVLSTRTTSSELTV